MNKALRSDWLNKSPSLLAQIPESEQTRLTSALEDPHIAAHLAYFQRWLSSTLAKQVDQHFLNKAKQHDETWLPLDQYAEEQQHQILDNLHAVQLSYGCSGACSFCGFDAVPKPRQHLPFPAIRRLVDMLAEKFDEESISEHQKIFYYWASDPFDYRSMENEIDKHYGDVHKLVQERLGYSPFVSTIAPRRSDAILHEFLKQGGEIGRLSVTSDDHRSSLSRRGILDKNGIEMVIDINPKPIGKFDQDKWKENVRRSTESTTIGCFNGCLVTPRGVYSILLLPRGTSYIDTPQYLHAVSFIGDNQKCPEVGESILDVLSQHIPLKDVSPSLTGHDEMYRMHREELRKSVFVIQTQGSSKVITTDGRTVLSVEDEDTFKESASLYEFDIKNQESVENLGRGYALTMAKLARIASEEFRTEIPIDNELIRQHVGNEISHTRIDRAADLTQHPLMVEAINGWASELNHEMTDSTLLATAVFLSPHWMVALENALRERKVKDVS